MVKGFVVINDGSVCKCDNPNIVIRGYSGKIKKQPIYYCYNCGHQFKSRSKKWKELAIKRLILSGREDENIIKEENIMNVKEKILLVQLLLEDVRGNWGWEKHKGFRSRVKKARELCDEIADELNDNRFLTLASRCNEYINEGDDGRFFRNEFPYGYENMHELHGLNYTYIDKSNAFKTIAEEYLTYPKYRFRDWENRFDD